MRRGTLAVLALSVGVLGVASACGLMKSKTEPGLDEKARHQVKQQLANMRDQVELVSFTGDDDAGRRAAAVYDEIAALQPKVLHKSLSPDRDQAAAGDLGIGMSPAVVIRKGAVNGLRFYGVPAGFEFSTFLEAVDRLSRDAPAVSARTAGTLADLRVPVEFKIFTTPS